jgi:hypothetical protein
VTWDERAFVEDVLEPLRAGEAAGVEAAIAFLEDDLWDFRTGYAKRKVMRALCSRTLDDAQRQRLERVVVHHVDVGERLEFATSCRLAAHLDVSRLRAPLVQRLASGDRGRARRAACMLAGLRGVRLDRRDVEAARRLILDLSAPRRFTGEHAEIVRLLEDSARHHDERLLRTLAVRFWSLEWEGHLLRLAEGDAPERGRALAVLQALPRLHGVDHDERLRRARKRARLLDRG